MSITQPKTLPEVRALRLHLRSDLCTVADCTCGSSVVLTYHDPRDPRRLGHDRCSSCGSDIYADVFHMREALLELLGRCIRKGNATHSANVARRIASFVRKHRRLF